jgi:hypothetical protein
MLRRAPPKWKRSGKRSQHTAERFSRLYRIAHMGHCVRNSAAGSKNTETRPEVKFSAESFRFRVARGWAPSPSASSCRMETSTKGSPFEQRRTDRRASALGVQMCTVAGAPEGACSHLHALAPIGPPQVTGPRSWRKTCRQTLLTVIEKLEMIGRSPQDGRSDERPHKDRLPMTRHSVGHAWIPTPKEREYGALQKTTVSFFRKAYGLLMSSADQSARLTPITLVALSRKPACPMCAARRTVRILEGFRTETFSCPSCDHVWEARKPRAPIE